VGHAQKQATKDMGRNVWSEWPGPKSGGGHGRLDCEKERTRKKRMRIKEEDVVTLLLDY